MTVDFSGFYHYDIDMLIRSARGSPRTAAAADEAADIRQNLFAAERMFPLMITYHFKPDSFRTFQEGIAREWAITNGIGGYAGSSLIGAHTRTHQGYLIASLHPPTERFLVFSKVHESIRADRLYSLETSQHFTDGNVCYANGQEYLTSFSYDGSAHYTYRCGSVTLRKHICLKPGENVCAVSYEMENEGEDAVLSLVPLFNFREHSASSTSGTLAFRTALSGNTLSLTPECRPGYTILFQASEGVFHEHRPCFDEHMQLQTEVELETPGLDTHYCPYEITVSLPAGSGKRLSLLCSLLPSPAAFSDISEEDAFSILKERLSYTKRLYATAGFSDPFANELALAADQFLSYRSSTGLQTILAGLPWFTDWGRDTMIAYTGLVLCTGKKKEAREILQTFALYVRHGIVPNMFPDDNTPPLYNTADASLWYFYAVWQYLQYYPAGEDYAFVRETIYPKLKEIIAAYREGTDFSIYMEEDGLIHAGSGLDQITWMDVRAGDWVPTPRHGKPVEINALWYNALKVMEQLAERFGDPSAGFSAADYRGLSERVKASFREKFWWEEKGCLYDVVDGDVTDDHLRPNQIYAVSLPFAMLDEAQELRIVSVVKEKLYAGCGLRSLSCDHPDYHGIYCGSLPKRDAAYHQGTAWGFLLGGFLTAYAKVHHHSKECIQEMLAMLEPVKRHLTDSGCIGSISEIFDGDAPHRPRGCYAQAWSVGEVLRAYAQDILPYLEQECHASEP